MNLSTLDADTPGLLIAGERVDTATGFGVVNPATGAVFARAPECSESQLDDAFAAAGPARLRHRVGEHPHDQRPPAAVRRVQAQRHRGGDGLRGLDAFTEVQVLHRARRA